MIPWSPPEHQGQARAAQQGRAGCVRAQGAPTSPTTPLGPGSRKESNGCGGECSGGMKGVSAGVRGACAAAWLHWGRTRGREGTGLEWRHTATMVGGRKDPTTCRICCADPRSRVDRITFDEHVVKKPAANELTYIDQLPALTRRWPPPKSTCERKEQSAREP